MKFDGLWGEAVDLLDEGDNWGGKSIELLSFVVAYGCVKDAD